MTTLSKTLIGQRGYERNHTWFFWTQQTVVLALLLILVFSSAFAVIYTRDLDRQLVSDWQGLQMQRTQVVQQYNQLWLEDSAWSTQGQIIDKATNRLSMVLPNSQSITTLVS